MIPLILLITEKPHFHNFQSRWVSQFSKKLAKTEHKLISCAPMSQPVETLLAQTSPPARKKVKVNGHVQVHQGCGTATVMKFFCTSPKSWQQTSRRSIRSTRISTSIRVQENLDMK